MHDVGETRDNEKLYSNGTNVFGNCHDASMHAMMIASVFNSTNAFVTEAAITAVRFCPVFSNLLYHSVGCLFKHHSRSQQPNQTGRWGLAVCGINGILFQSPFFYRTPGFSLDHAIPKADCHLHYPYLYCYYAIPDLVCINCPPGLATWVLVIHPKLAVSIILSSTLWPTLLP